jgi:hypothetical protein
MVGPRDGATWTVTGLERCGLDITVMPSLHCAPNLGGCGAHGFVTNGRWT